MIVSRGKVAVIVLLAGIFMAKDRIFKSDPTVDRLVHMSFFQALLVLILILAIIS